MFLPPQCSSIVSEILQRYAGRQLPLQRTEEEASSALSLVRGVAPDYLFPAARAPIEATAGLLLWLGDWGQAHEIADIESQDAYYWHAIIHRIEPDIGNAAYWFRKVGRHPIFPELLQEANNILDANKTACTWSMHREWDPFLFNRWCEEARRHPESAQDKVARAIQQAEWALLFPWCTRLASAETKPVRVSSVPA